MFFSFLASSKLPETCYSFIYDTHSTLLNVVYKGITTLGNPKLHSQFRLRIYESIGHIMDKLGHPWWLRE